MHRLLDPDAAQGQQPPDDLRQIEPLGETEARMRRGFGALDAPQPAAAAEAPLHAQNGVWRFRRLRERGESAQGPMPATSA